MICRENLIFTSSTKNKTTSVAEGGRLPAMLVLFLEEIADGILEVTIDCLVAFAKIFPCRAHYFYS